MPALTASSTAYWIKGLSTNGSISLGEAFVAGKKRVPRPAAGMMALETFREGISSGFYGPLPYKVKQAQVAVGRLFPFTSRRAICRISSIFCDVSAKPSMNGRRLLRMSGEDREGCRFATREARAVPAPNWQGLCYLEAGPPVECPRYWGSGA